MTRWSGGWALAILLTAMVGAVGCGGTDQSPLGGPYGGTSAPPGPTQGTGGPSGASTAPAPAPADGGTSAEAAAGGSTGGGHGASPTAPTWSAVYAAYLGSGSPGRCAGCHNSMSSPSAAYAWLQSRGYIAGASTTLDGTGSCLAWFGGNMPPSGSANAQAVVDISAWAAAGALNN